MQITGGKVCFSRKFQPEQYGSKGADVEISFVMGEDEDLGNKLDFIGDLVKTKALQLCNLKVEAVPALVAPSDVAAAAAKIEPRKAGRPPKADKPLGEHPDDGGIPAGLKRVDPLAKILDEDRPGSKVAADGEDIGFDEDAAEAQPEITDAALSTAMNRKVADLKGKHGGAAPKLIKELINTFVEPPKKSHDIPQKLRGEFLKKLEVLK